MKNIIILLSVILLSLIGYGQENITDFLLKTKVSNHSLIGIPKDVSQMDNNVIQEDYSDKGISLYYFNDTCVAVSIAYNINIINSVITNYNNKYVKTGKLEWKDYEHKHTLTIIPVREKDAFIDMIAIGD